MTIAVSGFNSGEVWLKSNRLIGKKVLTLEKLMRLVTLNWRRISYLNMAGNNESKVSKMKRSFFLSNSIYVADETSDRVWKCICGIRDLTEIRCGRENAKYFDWKRDSAAPLGARITNICVQEAGFFAYLSGVREDISSIAANARSNRLAFSSVSYESKLQWNLYQADNLRECCSVRLIQGVRQDRQE